MLNVIDLFAGAGGLSLGAVRAGFNVAAAVEIDSHAINTHKENFPATRHIQQDIMTLNGAQLLQLAALRKEDVTGIIGGPPCQGFSSIGRGDVNDDRNKLFEKFFEIVREIQPVFFVAENVPGIMNPKYDEIRKRAFQHVKDYHLMPPLKINASEYGAATTRTRYFFIGIQKSSAITIIPEDIEKQKVTEENRTTVRKALEGLPADIQYRENCDGVMSLMPNYRKPKCIHGQSDFFFQRATGMRPAGVGDPEYVKRFEENDIVNGFLPTCHSDVVSRRYAALGFGQRDCVSKSSKLDPDSFCPTLRSGTGPEKGSYQAVRPIHYQYARVITPREAARLQGFPDWYKLPPTIWHSFRQIGNSVSPIAAEQVLKVLYQKLI